MAFTVEYFHERVLAEIESWPVDVVADYARLVELVAEYGPNRRLPHSRALGDGLFELRPRCRSGTGRAFYCFMLGKAASMNTRDMVCMRNGCKIA
jgi:phage-related protein